MSGEEVERHISINQFVHKKVIDHFKNSEEYRIRKGIIHEKEDPFIIDFIRTHAQPNDKILEVGGGSGAFLDLTLENTGIKEAHNVELVYKAYRIQANEEISLIGGDALALPFKDNSFEWICVKNLLHHLAGATRRGSKENARKAIKEMMRVCKDGRYIVLLEQYNKYRLCSSAIFYLTFLFSLFSIGLKAFGLGKDVVVSFLTPDEINRSLTGSNDVKIVLSLENQLKLPRKWKFSFLMSNIGRSVIIGRKSKNQNRKERSIIWIGQERDRILSDSR